MDKVKLKELIQSFGQTITDEQLEKIVNLHDETIKGGYIKKSDHEIITKELETAKSDIKTRDVQISELKKFEGTNEELNKKIKGLEEANAEIDKKAQAGFILERKKNALKFKLLEEPEQPHKVDFVADMFNLDVIAVDDKGAITSGYKEQYDNIRKDNAFLFKAAINSSNFAQGNNNPNNGGFKPIGADRLTGQTLRQQIRV